MKEKKESDIDVTTTNVIGNIHKNSMIIGKLIIYCIGFLGFAIILTCHLQINESCINLAKLIERESDKEVKNKLYKKYECNCLRSGNICEK